MNIRLAALLLTMSATVPLAGQIQREILLTTTTGADIDPERRARTIRRELIRRYQPVFTELALPPTELEALKRLLVRREEAKRGPKAQGASNITGEIHDLLGDAFDRWSDASRFADVRTRWVRDFAVALAAADAPALSSEQDAALVDRIREVEDIRPPSEVERDSWRRSEMARRAAIVLDAKQAAVFDTFLQFVADRTQANRAGVKKDTPPNPARDAAIRHYQVRLDIQKSYGEFFREQNLLPAQCGALRDFLTAEREPLVAFAEAALATEPRGRVQQEIDLPARDERRRRVLGESLTSALLAFESTQTARRKAEWLAVDCVDWACPLDSAQQRAIVAIIVRHPLLPRGTNPDAPGALSDFEQAQLDEARAILTPDQQRVFTVFLTDDHAARDRAHANVTRK